MARKKNGEKHWRDVVARQARSGLSIREFCASVGISTPSFYAWRRKLRERDGQGTQFKKSRRRVEEPGNARPFIPLRLLDSASALEVIHPLGYRIRVTGEVDAHGLRQVLDMLDGRADR